MIKAYKNFWASYKVTGWYYSRNNKEMSEEES